MQEQQNESDSSSRSLYRVTLISLFLFGIIFLIISLISLIEHETRYLTNIKYLNRISSVIQLLPSSEVNTLNNSKLVYLWGKADISDDIHDKFFNFTSHSLKIKYAIYRFRDSNNKREWQVADSINSYIFKDLLAETGFIGNFTLSPFFFIDLPADTLINPEMLDTSNLKRISGKSVRIYDGGLYVGGNPVQPMDQDYRIKVYAAQPMIVSVIGKQINNYIKPVVKDNGELFPIIAAGKLSPDQLIAYEKKWNVIYLWLVRLLTLAGAYIGCLLWFFMITLLINGTTLSQTLTKVGFFRITIIPAIIVWCSVLIKIWYGIQPDMIPVMLAISLIFISLVFYSCYIKYQKKSGSSVIETHKK